MIRLLLILQVSALILLSAGCHTPTPPPKPPPPAEPFPLHGTISNEQGRAIEPPSWN